MYLKRMEDLRVDHDLTQKDVADILNCQREVYRRYEKRPRRRFEGGPNGGGYFSRHKRRLGLRRRRQGHHRKRLRSTEMIDLRQRRTHKIVKSNSTTQGYALQSPLE